MKLAVHVAKGVRYPPADCLAAAHSSTQTEILRLKGSGPVLESAT